VYLEEEHDGHSGGRQALIADLEERVDMLEVVRLQAFAVVAVVSVLLLLGLGDGWYLSGRCSCALDQQESWEGRR